MSDRGNSDTIKSPKFIDLKDFQGVKSKVELQLRAPEGKRFWRSLDELSDTGEFREMINREFPAAAGEWDDNVSRRNFMKLMGASLALAGLTSACAPKPEEKIVPYVQQPEHLVPGKPLFFASAMPFGGFGKGVLVEQHEGRPTKIEGNPDHPSSKGAADVWGQATILTMYDPDRSQVITKFGNVSSWGTFNLALSDAITFQDWNGAKATRRSKPARIRLLTESITSPTIAAQVAALQQGFPDLKWHTYDAVGRYNTLAGAKQAFGEDVEPIYDFTKAKVVVTLDSNFFTEDPGSLVYARDYMSVRRVRATAAAAEKAKLAEPRLQPGNRLFAIESVPTQVGAVADHKLRVKPQYVHEFAAALHEAIAAGKPESKIFAASAWKKKTEKKHGEHFHSWFDELVEELLANKGKSIIVAGEYAPVEVHVLAHAINAALGNIASAADDGKPVKLIPVVEASPTTADSIKELTTALKAGEVDLLFILGGNPAYNAPAELDFAGVIKGLYPADEKTGKITGKAFVAHLGLYEDETARLVEWHLPETHFLEAWGDVRAHDGTASVVQPLIAPIYPACRSAVEVLAAVLEQATPANGAATKPNSPAAGSLSAYDIVRSVWRKAIDQGDKFEAAWTKALHDGYMGGTAYGPKAVTFKGDVAKASKLAAPSAGMTLMFRPDPHVWDGAFNNNAWLQELPKPLTKLTWDNALIISPGAAKALGLTTTDTGNVFKEKFSEAVGKTVDLTVNGQTLKDVPVWVMPGHPDECGTLHLGYGRSHAGRVGSPVDGKVGFNAYVLRTSDTRWLAPGADPKPNGGKYTLAPTQNHQVINHELNHKRELILVGNSIGDVAHHFEDELNKREGTVEEGHKEEGHKHEFKLKDPLANIKLGNRIGLPIIPDDPSNSPQSLFPEQPDHNATADRPAGHDPMYPAWGMVIDQTACIGCNACVVACQSENNIPVVGKDMVLVEREMHWLRIDTYHIGGKLPGDEHGDENEVNIVDPDGTYFQPLPCMHCEKAPCELVCPVGATIHSKEGLNDMAYNRCVGTRYCSNNCPYKVRRFNFLKYNDDATPVLKLLRNPEVTVRSRGVMEKCTYCTQRISRGRIEAKKVEVAAIEKGASQPEARSKFDAVLRQIQTACQQSCPTQAITFGNMWDSESEVTALKREPVGFHYGLLAELNTRPRTTYLARIENRYADFVDHGHAEPAGEKKDEHKH
ncbi:TAT-variant-translocated molybdopterin oxidoreductase [Humisphaera borealis]|uniref:TAT-variant-translocated molybdopterin oxidoreductase n=1 Tax=Humisphaera borealis TaxID=2807512 RepID=A0A7M2X1K1_9BACT|nr:TAT-variant-translocated molybdopterin oxidoreductase [Humisphaera borealis]QOV91544.1 TAT-variant-translocated molybdopterin oxidoreductase [Humisphaera borealis]